MVCKIFSRSNEGQASIESAFILPIALLCMGMALQPLLYMYTKSLCMEAAEEGVRFAMSEEKNSLVERYVRRRLDAIPQLDILHSGLNDDWNIEIIRSDNQVQISITGHMHQLPLLGLTSKFIIPHDGDELRIQVEAQAQTKPAWIEGDYYEWTDSFR